MLTHVLLCCAMRNYDSSRDKLDCHFIWYVIYIYNNNLFSLICIYKADCAAICDVQYFAPPCAIWKKRHMIYTIF